MVGHLFYKGMVHTCPYLRLDCIYRVFTHIYVAQLVPEREMDLMQFPVAQSEE